MPTRHNVEGNIQAEGFENRALRGMFTPQGDEIRGGWRKLHGELCNLLFSSLLHIGRF